MLALQSQRSKLPISAISQRPIDQRHQCGTDNWRTIIYGCSQNIRSAPMVRHGVAYLNIDIGAKCDVRGNRHEQVHSTNNQEEEDSYTDFLYRIKIFT